MKKIDIALLVMAGALAGAFVMKLIGPALRVAPERAKAPVEQAVAQTPIQPAAVVEAKPSAFEETKPEPAQASGTVSQPPESPLVEPEADRNESGSTQGKTSAPAEAAVHRITRARRTIAQAAQRAPRPAPLAAPQAAESAPVADPIQTSTPPMLTPEQPKETPPARLEPENATPDLAPTAPPPNQATLNAGMLIPVRLLDSLSSERSHAGDVFAATLYRELVASGFVIAERGARVEGRVTAVDRAGHVLSLELTSVHTSDDQEVPIQTERFDKRGEPDRSNAALKVGGGAVIGAVIGGIADGGKGAAIGAAAGGGIGAGDVALSHRAATLPSETRLTFRLRAPVTITERTAQ